MNIGILISTSLLPPVSVGSPASVLARRQASSSALEALLYMSQFQHRNDLLAYGVENGEESRESNDIILSVLGRDSPAIALTCNQREVNNVLLGSNSRLELDDVDEVVSIGMTTCRYASTLLLSFIYSMRFYT